MAMLFTTAIQRLLALAVGNDKIEVIVEMDKDGLTFRRKGKRKSIVASWNKLLSQPDLFVEAEDSPKLTNGERAKIATNPIAFLFDA